MRCNENDTIVGYILGSENKDMVSLLVPLSLHSLIHYSHAIPDRTVKKMRSSSGSLSVVEKFIMSNLTCARLFYNESKKNRLQLLHGKEVERKSCLSLKKFFECNGTKGDYLDEIRGKKKVSFGSVDVCSAPSSQTISSPVALIVSKPRPAWIYTTIDSGCNLLVPTKQTMRRLMAYRGFYEMCSAFIMKLGPDYKKRNWISVALQFESAIYKYYGDANEDYWWKVIEIISAVVGWKKIGSLCDAILDGMFAEVEDVIKLPSKLLYRSFDGLPMF